MTRRIMTLVIGSLVLVCGCDDGVGIAPMILTTSLRDGGQLVPYVDTLRVAGVTPGYQELSIVSGSLPPGLSVFTAVPGGVVVGVPEQLGTWNFTVQVREDRSTATQALSLTIVVAPVLEPYELCSDYPWYSTVTFEDADLLEAVRQGVVDQPTALGCEAVSQAEGVYSGQDQPDVSSLLGIQNLTGLAELFVQSGTVSDLAPLSDLSGLRSLHLSDNAITDISPLAGLVGLEDLDLSVNQLASIDVLAGFTQLRSLRLVDSNATDIDALSGLTELTEVYLVSNAITDVSALAGLTMLTTLDLQVNQVVDVSPLEGLTNLSVLMLFNNRIEDLSPLGQLSGLTRLQLGLNNISVLGDLSGLTSVTYLDLSSNSISDISTLSGLTSLTELHLSYNPALGDIQPLLDNTGLGAGDQVSLAFTSVSCADADLLRANGVIVDSTGCS